MAYFPVLQRLQVSDYGLYPGKNRDNQLDIDFKSGLNVILGANGLGKSTLIKLIFRMLTGPSDIDMPEGNIGSARLEAGSIKRKEQQTFAVRVIDGAVNARATLTYSIGPRLFCVTRALKNLSLVSYCIDDEIGSGEKNLQRALTATSGSGSFGEFIFLLRTMVFFFEDRRQLVWDPSAQRQLLRQLLLTAEKSEKWKLEERVILQLDTRMRNLNAALYREEQEDARAEAVVTAAPEITAQLKDIETNQDVLKGRQEQLLAAVEEQDALRHRYRLDLLRAESQLHSSMRELERARLAAIETRFPEVEASMRYIFSRLMTDDLCLVCNTEGRVETRNRLKAAIDAHHCVVCDARVEQLVNVVDFTKEQISQLQTNIAQAHSARDAAKALHDEAVIAYEKAAKEHRETVASLTENEVLIAALIRRLPAAEQMRRRSSELNALKGRVQSLRTEINEKRQEFNALMVSCTSEIRTFADRIKSEFDAAANGFLLENSSLSWAPVRQNVGQARADGLDPVQYPAFSIEMTGADFGEISVRRDSPDQVSESQREFIDLAFRMALVQVAAPDQAATILIDAPESSLDAVFVARAAAVLARFANKNPQNRLVATSNLAAGQLIPKMLLAAEHDATLRRDRIIDLFELGVPTRAMQSLHDEYQELRQELFIEIGEEYVHDD